MPALRPSVSRSVGIRYCLERISTEIDTSDARSKLIIGVLDAFAQFAEQVDPAQDSSGEILDVLVELEIAKDELHTLTRIYEATVGRELSPVFARSEAA